MRDDLTAIYGAAVAAVDPTALVRSRVTRRGRVLQIALAPGQVLTRRVDRLWVAGAGKAALAMALAIADLAPEVHGAVVVPSSRDPGRTRPRKVGRIAVYRGDHPVPGARTFAATARVLRELAARPKHDTVLFLLSGGASALFAAPAPGITRSDKVALTRHLLRCGAPIEVMNAVRKHVSAVKGGGFALLAAPREVITLALSDVPGDALATIGSGPTVADPTTFVQVLRMMRASDPLRATVPSRIWHHLEAGAAAAGPPETAKPGDRRLRRSTAAVIGTNRTALAAAAAEARHRGYDVLRRRIRLSGEAAACAEDVVSALDPRARRPVCVLGGGETFVTAGRSAGKGGRCQELALAVAAGITDSRWSLLCAGTDGIDGQTDAAGAFCDGTTLRRGGIRRVASSLRGHDSYTFFSRLDDLFTPGPTATNVMDVVIALHPGSRDP